MSLSIKNYNLHQEDIKKICLKYYQWALDNQINSLGIVIADQYYYNQTLQQRRDILNAPGIQFLCKTIVFENTSYNPKFQGPYYPQYVAVMVQYISKINTEKLNKEIKLHQNSHAPEKAGKQYFHYRLVEEQKSAQLTGYEHNGVVPVLLKTSMPIIFSHHIQNLQPKFFWMGAGHPWIKMRISFQDFERTYNNTLLVRDITY